MNAPMYYLLVGSLSICGLAEFGRAEVLAEYQAPEPPTAISGIWNAAGAERGASAGHEAEPSWRISPAERESLNYHLVEAEEIVRQSFERGWHYAARIKLDVSKFPDIDPLSVTLAVENAELNKAFILQVGAVSGVPTISVNRKQLPVPSLDPNAFNTYAMIYHPASSTVDVTVNGETIAKGIEATSTNRWFLRWGHSSINARGAADWSWVRFTSPLEN